MKKSLYLSVILLSLFGVTAQAHTFKVGDCTQNPDEFLNINGALGSNVTITETAGYYGDNGQQQPFDFPVQSGGNTPQLLAADGNAACMQQNGVTSLQIALTKMTTNTYGQKNVVNCVINTGVKPQTINLNVTWDAASKTYVCR